MLEVSFARYSDKSERNRRFVINLLSICKGMLGATSNKLSVCHSCDPDTPNTPDTPDTPTEC